MSDISSILGQTNPDNYKATTNKIAEDKDMFLKLLVAQLSNQDPLNPVEDKEFITQLAQFTSVEELQKINSGIGSLNEITVQSQLASSIGLVGKTIVASGNIVTKYSFEDDDGKKVHESTRLFYSTDYDLAECNITVLNSANQIVYYEMLGAKTAGEHPFDWSGKNFNGVAVPDGYYKVAVSGKDVEGRGQLVNTEVFGDVYAVEVVNGEHYLNLTDGRKVKYTDITMVGNRSTGSGGETPDPEPDPIEP